MPTGTLPGVPALELGGAEASEEVPPDAPGGGAPPPRKSLVCENRVGETVRELVTRLTGERDEILGALGAKELLRVT